MEEPVTYDYIFHKGMSPGTKTWADWSEFLILRTNIINQAQEVSITLSDHEPVISTIYVEKWQFWPFI